ncbi:MAG: D-3-phosphoglycerate dehydrogenase [Phycisphaerales bacterium]|jgi:D-3-phosphoglycerate dehydrogenase
MSDSKGKPWRVLLTGPRMLRDFERLRARFEQLPVEVVLAEVRQHLNEDELIESLDGIDGTICGGDHHTARVMDARPQLRVICKWGTGVDAIDREAARARGIAVRNVPDAFSVPVADHTMGMMLNFSRRLAENDRLIRQGLWSPVDAVSLAELTLGVVGIGAIGQTVLRRARAFGMMLLGTDPVRPPQQVIDETGVEIVGMDELLERADVVSMHCDLNPTSRRLMSTAQFARMKKSAVFINTSRGGVVDQPVLEKALADGEIAGAGLDVFESEPICEGSPLRAMPNVMLTPHQANSSPRAAWAVHERTMASLIELLESTPSRDGTPRVDTPCVGTPRAATT